MKKFVVLVLLLVFILSFAVGCSGNNWENKFDTSLNLNDDGWELTFFDDFVATSEFSEGDTALNPKYWSTSPHGLRNQEYWCDQMVEVKDGKVIVRSEKRTDHKCEICVDKEGNPVTSGIFTSGIETRAYVQEDGEKKNKQLFSQAFGYFETSVIVPRADAMWSAFWLQSVCQGKIGNSGIDGTEIDVYESSFWKDNPTKTGNALHYDGYNEYHRSTGKTTDIGKNLYDGEYHTYGLKWTPNEYVFYVDGVAIWATNYGGVSRVPQFLRLTVEIRENIYGPYAQKLGTFNNASDGSTDFIIDYVKVYQNDTFLPYIQSDSDFSDKSSLFNTLKISAIVIGSVIILGIVVLLVYKISRKKNKAK